MLTPRKLEQKTSPEMRIKIRSLRIAIYDRLKEQEMTVDELVIGLLSEPGIALADLNLLTGALNGLREDDLLRIVGFKTNLQKLKVELVFRARGYE